MGGSQTTGQTCAMQMQIMAKILQPSFLLSSFLFDDIMNVFQRHSWKGNEWFSTNFVCIFKFPLTQPEVDVEILHINFLVSRWSEFPKTS